MEGYIKWIDEVGLEDLKDVGGRGACLGELCREGFSVPTGFTVPVRAFDLFLKENELIQHARTHLLPVDRSDAEGLRRRAETFQAFLQDAEIPAEAEAGIRKALERLQQEETGAAVLAVSSSMVAEGLSCNSLPGKPDIFLSIKQIEDLLKHLKECWSAAWDYRMLAHCLSLGVDPFSVKVALLVQKLVRMETAGTLATWPALSSARKEMVIDACWGLGRTVMPGRHHSDRFVLQKGSLELLEQQVGGKEKMVVPNRDGSPLVMELDVPEDKAEMPCLSWEQIQDVAEAGSAIERCFGEAQDIQWAFESGDLYILDVCAVQDSGTTGEVPSADDDSQREGRIPVCSSEEEEEESFREPEEKESEKAGFTEEILHGVEISDEAAALKEAETRMETEAPLMKGAQSPEEAEPSKGKEIVEEAKPPEEEEPEKETGGLFSKPGSDDTEGGSRKPEEPPPHRPHPWDASDLCLEQKKSRRGKMNPYPGWKLSTGGRLRAEALSSLFGAAKRLKGQGGAIRERDELHHDHNDSYYWNESYYFNFSDPERRVGGFSRIGMVPNQTMAVGILYIYLKDGGVLMLTQSEPCEASRDDVITGLLRYERVRPLWEWRILFQGKMLYLPDPRKLPSLMESLDADPVEAEKDLQFKEASVDIVFKGWSPCHNFKDADPRFVAERFVNAGSRMQDLMAVTKVASEHYEQVGTWAGQIVVDGERMEIQGSGHRDHSWGERDWKAPERWTWLTAQFGNDFGFNLCRVVIKSLDVYNGYICRSGRNYSLRRAWLETEFEEDGLTQKRVLLRLQDTSGWEAEIEGHPRIVVPLTLKEGTHTTRVNEAFTEYRWKGRTGYGISEYLHQL